MKYSENRTAEQPNRPFARDAKAYSEQQSLLNLDTQEASLWKNVNQSWKQNATEKDLRHVIRNFLVLQRPTSEERVYSFIIERKEMVADRSAVDLELRLYKSDMETKLGAIQTSLSDVT